MPESTNGNLWIEEVHISEDENCLLDEPYPYETYTSDRGELFRSLQKEHGACTRKLYIYGKDGEAQAIGWVFRKRRPYEDVPTESYLHTVWVTVMVSEPKRTVTVEYDYA